MNLPASATRMELLRLRRRLAIAHRGHKLLKDKQEELMRQLLALIADIRTVRARVREEMKLILTQFAIARGAFGRRHLLEAVMAPTRRVTIKVGTKKILNIPVPVFTREVSGRRRCYGFAFTSGELDLGLKALDELLELLLLLAEKEKAVEIIARELERTRRRVNALEFILIPSLTETIRMITFKLAETERQDLVRLMRIKDIVQGEKEGGA